uniref:Alpha-2,8-sialyltransferase n=1 Tax=Chelonoidis abingdonii TaxID=106734 RepID=A0A8C0H1A8_CHEAB
VPGSEFPANVGPVVKQNSRLSPLAWARAAASANPAGSSSQPLTEGSPFQGAPYECCAVVGNGGILRDSGCGPEIDRAQFVIRFNLPPLSFAADVGTKSSIVTMNPSILHARFRGLGRWRRPFAEAVGAYGAALLLVPAFSFAAYTAVSFQALYTLEDFGSPARTLFMNPEYLARLDGHWRSHGLRPNRLSSGFMLVSSALEMCRHLTLYGFWPFPSDPEARPLPHHYYDNQPPRSGVHAMPEEFTRYLGMHLQGCGPRPRATRYGGGVAGCGGPSYGRGRLLAGPS